jgi:DNA polymerase IV
VPRKILHLDLDAFFCAVEEIRDPTLRGKPFAVGGQPNARGVVASCSYPARQYGVRSAMPMSQAVRRCPNLIIISHNFGAYRQFSEKVMARLHDLTPDVEQISIDEAFLDVTLLRDDAEAVARQLQAVIRADLDLPCSLGVATNKLVAKIANNIGKAQQGGDAPPNAITVVPPGSEAAFLAPLPVGELWGVGPKTAEELQRIGIRTIGDLAARSSAELTRRFGKHGGDMALRARGIDERPVENEGDAKSVSKETTFTRDVTEKDKLEATLRALSDAVGRRLRADGLSGRTVKIKLRWSDFTTLTRQISLPQPTHHDDTIYEAARTLLLKTWTQGQPVRLIGVGVSGFEEMAVQRGFWDAPERPQDARLEAALDKLHERYGDMIRRGSDINDL